MQETFKTHCLRMNEDLYRELTLARIKHRCSLHDVIILLLNRALDQDN